MWKQVLIVFLAVAVFVAMLPVREATTSPFASPAFEQIWLRDQNGLLDLWGQGPLAWRLEPYADAPSGRRLVQYFDRGRMELTSEAGSTRTLVTQGRLAWELTTGQIALGSDLTARRPPPDISIDGGSPDPRVPTYAALARLVGQPATDRTGWPQPIDQWLTADGTLRTATPPAPVRMGRFVTTTRHNLPDVTVALFDRSPLGATAWLETFGYPISEPVWAYYRRGNVAIPALVQVFERRILLYFPSLPADQRFTVANTGRHYYRWRYGSEPTAPWPAPLPGTPLPLDVPTHFRAGLLLDGVRDPIDLALAPDGNLLVLTASGTMLLVTAEDSQGRASRLTTFASGFLAPRGAVASGGWVYVADDRGLIRLRDDDGDGIADRTELLPVDLRPLPGPAGAPVVDERGRLVLAATTTDAPETPLLYVIEDRRASPLGPVPGHLVRLFTWGELLLAVTQAEGEPASVLRLTASEDPSASRPLLDFPPDVGLSSGIVYTVPLWADPIPGTWLFCGTRNGSGVVLRALPRSDAQSAELAPFVTGLRRPVALAIGLDGTIYIADAGTGQVVKLVPTLRSSR